MIDPSEIRVCTWCVTPLVQRENEFPSSFKRRDFCGRQCSNSATAYRVSKRAKERFFDGVCIRGTDECWDWMGPVGSGGYGHCGIRPHQRAHRASYALLVGEIPNGLFVCHKCDNPICVNPNHLFLGTAKENTQDMLQKGRGGDLKGTKNGASRLSEAQVLSIRRQATQGVGRREIAKTFGVSEANVYRVINRETWAHI